VSPIIFCVCCFHLKFLWTPSANLSDRRVASLLFPVTVFLSLPFLPDSFFFTIPNIGYMSIFHTHILPSFLSKSPSRAGISFNKLYVCTAASIVFICLVMYISCLHHIISHRTFNFDRFYFAAVKVGKSYIII